MTLGRNKVGLLVINAHGVEVENTDVCCGAEFQCGILEQCKGETLFPCDIKVRVIHFNGDSMAARHQKTV